jgi:hypothetical protein
MAVRKFRDVSEMEKTLWREPGSPMLFRAIAGVWELASRTTRRRFPPGVYKHRSVENAGQLRERWDEENFRAFWARKRASDRQV